MDKWRIMFNFRALNRNSIELLRQRGVEWLYLWTDCTCNWQYYVNHGYEKIGEGVAPEFSTDKEDYTYYMFRKRIL